MAQIDKSLAPFTYTGTWDINEYSPGLFYARFLTSGTLTPKHPFVCDAFLVGGGGGGGGTDTAGIANASPASGGAGGGYTATHRNILIDSLVSVEIGSGGSSGISSKGQNGGPTTFGPYSVLGGYGSESVIATPEDIQKNGSGGNGGSGGGRAGSAGGRDGSDGMPGGYGGTVGKGQGTTTKAFEGDKPPFDTMLFSGGGSGADRYGDSDPSPGTESPGGGGRGAAMNNRGVSVASTAGKPNTGGGGGGGISRRISGSDYSARGSSGGSGIVIIRGILVLNRPVFVSGIDWVPHKVSQFNVSGQKIKAGWANLNGELTKIY